MYIYMYIHVYTCIYMYIHEKGFRKSRKYGKSKTFGNLRKPSETFGNHRKPSETIGNPLKPLETFGNPRKPSKNSCEKLTFGTKFVGIARKSEISIPIDAARSGELENRGFCQFFPKFEGNTSGFPSSPPPPYVVGHAF